MLASAAVSTKTLNLGTLVFDVDYRHPVILAKAAADLHLLSGGRFEFGLGAGWDNRDYNMSGIPFDRPGIRIERLDEALQIIRNLWIEETTTFQGKHYSITNMVKAGDLPEGEHPKIMVGGGGRKVLTVAGKYADIVGIHWSLSLEGGDLKSSVRETTLDQVKRRIHWVEQAAEDAGRNPDNIEYQMLFPGPRITDNPKVYLEEMAQATGATVEDLRACPQCLIGSSMDICEKLTTLRAETGITYMVFGPADATFIDTFAESIMKPLLS
jgi:probable F420-dependent oxidoreductase